MDRREKKELIVAMAKAVELFRVRCPDLNPKGKIGGVLVFADIFGKVAWRVEIWSVPDEDLPKYVANAERKIQQLRENPRHKSSFQSRNPKNGQWGGGLRTPWGMMAFSGLPEAADEACLLKALLSCRLVTWDYTREIVCLSSNVVFNRLF